MPAEPTYLDPAKVGAAVVQCPGCGQERWYGYGACGRCGTYLASETKPPVPTCCHGIDDVCVAAGCLLGIHGGERGLVDECDQEGCSCHDD